MQKEIDNCHFCSLINYKEMGMTMKDEQVPLQMKIWFGNQFFVHNGAHIKTHECPYKK
jgi:hypothetical protein